MSLPSDLVLAPLLAALAAILLGWIFAFLRTRGNAPWLFAVDALLLAPALIPGPVLAGLLVAAQCTALGGDGIWVAAMLPVALPLAYLPARLCLSRIQQDYAGSIHLLGLGFLMRIIKVDLPLAAPALCLGAALVAARVFGEWIVTIAALDRFNVITLSVLSVSFGAGLLIAMTLQRSGAAR